MPRGLAATRGEHDDARVDRDFFASLGVDVRNARGESVGARPALRGTMAPVRISRLPVARAGRMWTPGEAKFALTAQARPHSAQ